MKQYRITLEDRTFDVKVLDDPRREKVRVEVDGEILIVGVESVSPRVEAAISAPAPTVAPPSTAPSSPSSRNTLEASGSSGNAVAAPQAVPAPLPGVIKSIAVRPGQRIAADDELLVIEAMKMDNVIRAPRGGTVGTVHVTEGRRVAYGEVLVEMANEQMSK